MIKQYSGFQPRIYTERHRRIDEYVRNIPFEVRRERLIDREHMYIDFKNWMYRVLKVDSGELYDYGIQRITWKLWI